MSASKTFSPTPDKTESVTVSVGVCQLRHGEEIGELVKRADIAMYRAKSEGKNRVAFEE